ncbi:hypothetical protein [Dactylosporangium sp. NPDC051541]|uniref:hypothetical protein n=1 Tax=Dactylosporangium sp. NPDC051541 TaxID=3363977 RepID=UPI0037A39533
MATFERVWRNILAHAGEEFLTKRGLPFRYTIDGNAIVPDRTQYPLHISQVRLAVERWPVSGPGQLNDLVRGPSYLYALLADARIMAGGR